MLLMRKAKKPRKDVNPLSAMVRCLGLGDEHLFRSPDPVNIRICNRCKRRMEAGRVYCTPVSEVH